jgi:integrase
MPRLREPDSDRSVRLMARRAAGSVTTRENKDGSLSHDIRVRWRRERVTITLTGVSRAVAESERELILAKIRAGIFTPDEHRAALRPPAPDAAGDEPTVHVLASECMAEWKADLEQGTYDIYLWLLQRHLLPFFANYTPSQIDRRLLRRFRAQKLKEREDLRAMRERGVVVRGRNNTPLRGLGDRKLNQAFELLGRILDEAVERDLIETNPARERKLRRKVDKPVRSFLELDELNSLLDAAGELEAEGRTDLRVAEIRRMRAAGSKLREIAERFDVTVSTASYWCRDHTRTAAPRRLGWEALVTALAYTGLRISELLDLRWAQLHLPNRRLWVADAKTATGRREVQLSPVLTESLIDYRQALRTLGSADGSDDFVFPSQARTRLSDDNVRARLVRPAVARANAARAAKGLPPLPPNVTPHTLRRTYISIALIASEMDLKWVMSQVGHAHSSTTMEVYNQLLQRRDRDGIGARFDALVTQAREALGGLQWDINGRTGADDAVSARR